jgi:hypothetical protein
MAVKIAEIEQADQTNSWHFASSLRIQFPFFVTFRHDFERGHGEFGFDFKPLLQRKRVMSFLYTVHSS